MSRSSTPSLQSHRNSISTPPKPPPKVLQELQEKNLSPSAKEYIRNLERRVALLQDDLDYVTRRGLPVPRPKVQRPQRAPKQAAGGVDDSFASASTQSTLVPPFEVPGASQAPTSDVASQDPILTLQRQNSLLRSSLETYKSAYASADRMLRDFFNFDPLTGSGSGGVVEQLRQIVDNIASAVYPDSDGGPPEGSELSGVVKELAAIQGSYEAAVRRNRDAVGTVNWRMGNLDLSSDDVDGRKFLCPRPRDINR